MVICNLALHAHGTLKWSSEATGMCTMSDELLTLDDIRAAEKVVRESNLKVRHTPCIQVRGGSHRTSIMTTGPRSG